MSSSDTSIPLLGHDDVVEEEGTSHSGIRLVIRFVDRPDITLVLSKQIPIRVLKQKVNVEFLPSVNICFIVILLDELTHYRDTSLFLISILLVTFTIGIGIIIIVKLFKFNISWKITRRSSSFK
jgi:hypothetical protein